MYVLGRTLVCFGVGGVGVEVVGVIPPNGEAKSHPVLDPVVIYGTNRFFPVSKQNTCFDWFKPWAVVGHALINCVV